MKDLITIGIFAVIYFLVIYFLVMFGVGMIPILFLVYPILLGIVIGTIIILFMAKVKKSLGLFVLGILSPLLMFAIS